MRLFPCFVTISRDSRNTDRSGVASLFSFLFLFFFFSRLVLCRVKGALELSRAYLFYYASTRSLRAKQSLYFVLRLPCSTLIYRDDFRFSSTSGCLYSFVTVRLTRSLAKRLFVRRTRT